MTGSLDAFSNLPRLYRGVMKSNQYRDGAFY
jgi:hypothetical protein